MSKGWIIASVLNELFDLLKDPELRARLSEASGLNIIDPIEERIFV
jgi:hypothetical protein